MPSRAENLKKPNGLWQTATRDYRSFTEFKTYLKALRKENKMPPLSDSQWVRIWRMGLGL